MVASISSAAAASCSFSHASIRAVSPFSSVSVASAPSASSFATVPARPFALAKCSADCL